MTNFYDAVLDRAVWTASGWPEPPDETDPSASSGHAEGTLALSLALNLERLGD